MINYSRTIQQQFGRTISNFQAIAFKIADMATKIESAELLIYKAAYLKNKGQKNIYVVKVIDKRKIVIVE